MKWMQSLDHKRWFWVAAFVLLVLSALTYLSKVTSFGYYNDDWYLIYDSYTQGPSIYYEVFSGDRPLRAFVMIAAYHLFGVDVLAYNLSAYFFRFLSGVGFLWLLTLLWREQRKATLGMAILFLLYPGFMSQHNGIDYQSQMISLAFVLFSIALTVKAILTPKSVQKVVYFVLSLLLGWIYLGLVEYFIGFEVLRFAIIFLLAAREKEKFLERILLALQKGWGYLVIGFLFLFWRVFLFDNERKATSLTAQFDILLSSPAHTGLWWLVYLFRGLLDVFFFVWVVPFRSFATTLRLRDFLVGVALSSLLGVIVFFIFNWQTDREEEKLTAEFSWRNEALWIGLLSAAGGILPIIMVNRYIDFSGYSRYTLGAAAGSAMLVIALLDFLNKREIKFFALSGLVFISTFTHFGNATNLANATLSTNDFWWQMSWRAPKIEEGTTLVIEYPRGSLSEDYLIWGAANLLYYPELPKEIPLRTPLSGLLLTPDHINDIRTQQGQSNSDGRGYQSTRDFRQVLIAVQSSPNGCVRVLNGERPELSMLDSTRIQLVAPYSQNGTILTKAEPPTPLEFVFGAEPEHRWCYYYQKASLARQQGNWDQVIQLMEKALAEGFYPVERVEWMPLLEAYTQKGEKEKMRPYVSILREEPFLAQQACGILLEAAQTDEIKTYIEKKFCE